MTSSGKYIHSVFRFDFSLLMWLLFGFYIQHDLPREYIQLNRKGCATFCHPGEVKKQSDSVVKGLALRSTSDAWKSEEAKSSGRSSTSGNPMKPQQKAVDLGWAKWSELLYVAARGMPQITA